MGSANDTAIFNCRSRLISVTPASRTALLLGRTLRDTVVLLVQSVVLTLVAAGGLVAGVWPRLQEYR